MRFYAHLSILFIEGMSLQMHISFPSQMAYSRLLLNKVSTLPSVLTEWKNVRKIQKVLSDSVGKAAIGFAPLGMS